MTVFSEFKGIQLIRPQVFALCKKQFKHFTGATMPSKRKLGKKRAHAAPYHRATRVSQPQQPTSPPPATPVSPADQHTAIEKAQRRLKSALARQDKALAAYHSTPPSSLQFAVVTVELHEATRSLIYARAAYGETCATI